VPPHLFVRDIADPEIVGDDLHHADRVLRLRNGERVTVGDGAGNWRQCAWRIGGRPEPDPDIHHDPRPTPSLAVGFALTKGDKPSVVVQKLTECGVDRILPLIAERSVVRWDTAKAGAAVQRWKRVAREAAMQSHRTWLPAIEEIADFRTVINGEPAALAHMGGAALASTHTCILIGPEGGWTEAELDGAATVRLGSQVLRADTAAVAAGVLLNALRDRIVQPPLPTNSQA